MSTVLRKIFWGFRPAGKVSVGKSSSGTITDPTVNKQEGLINFGTLEFMILQLGL